MLVLSRRPGETINIGHNITVRVVEIVGGRVKLGIDAPQDMRILRSELAFWSDQPSKSPEPVCDIMMR